jgi:hypothetical protein
MRGESGENHEMRRENQLLWNVFCNFFWTYSPSFCFLDIFPSLQVKARNANKKRKRSWSVRITGLHQNWCWCGGGCGRRDIWCGGYDGIRQNYSFSLFLSHGGECCQEASV